MLFLTLLHLCDDFADRIGALINARAEVRPIFQLIALGHEHQFCDGFEDPEHFQSYNDQARIESPYTELRSIFTDLRDDLSVQSVIRMTRSVCEVLHAERLRAFDTHHQLMAVERRRPAVKQSP